MPNQQYKYVSGILTETFEIRRGVKQDFPLSASLYSLAINPILKKLKKMSGCMAPVGFDVNYNAVMYEVLSENLPQLQKDFYWCIISTVVM